MTPNVHNTAPPKGFFYPSIVQTPQRSIHQTETLTNTPLARPRRRAFPIPFPPKPLIFKWRCCETWCDNSLPPLSPRKPNRTNANTNTNTTHTTTHFRWAYTCVGDRHEMAYTWQPGYRDEECSRCGHKACSDCVFVSVDGWTEWRGEDGENETGKGVWARLGVWDKEGSVEASREGDGEVMMKFGKWVRKFGSSFEGGDSSLD
jgi:hypothetical protein